MAKSELPLPDRIFVPRKAPSVLIFGDGEVIPGPFCFNCGNPASVHRQSDDACPVRRLHALMPKGERERCTCQHRDKSAEFQKRAPHSTTCALIKYGYNGTAVR
jgi:hypothetical protein